MSPSPVLHPGSRGPLLAIGGAEDKVDDQVILRRFVTLSGSSDARIVVVPTASELPDSGQRYQALFQKLGAGQVEVLNIQSREDASQPEAVALLQDSSGVFITGGNQVRLSSVLGGTPVAQTLRRLHAAGAVLAGTSAGAAILSEHMIAFGRGGASPSQRMVQIVPGLGLTNRVIIDQHFRQRDRFGRLMTAVAYNPFLVGIGLDEDTAIVLDGHNRLTVVGQRSVTILDAGSMSYTDIHAAPSHEVFAMFNLRVHVLTAGCGYDLDRRVASPPPAYTGSSSPS